MSRIEFDWPDAGGEQVRGAEGRLRLAGADWAARGDEERWALIARVLDLWTRADSPWRRGLAQVLADATPFAAPTIAEGLDAAMRAWDPEAFVACARRELGPREDGRLRQAPFAWTSVIAGGAIPMPTLLQPLLSLATGSPVLLRTTSRDTATPDALARSLAAVDDGLAAAFEAITFPVDDAPAMDALLSAPCVVATGADETLEAIRRRLAPSTHFVPYGHRFSVAAFGRGLVDDEAARSRAIDGLARDVARWDQGGCLSPVALYLVGLDEREAIALAHEVAAALARLEETLPRGEVPAAMRAAHANERAEAKMRASGALPWVGGSAGSTVILETDAQPRPAPLGRFLRIHAVSSADTLVRHLAHFEGLLSSLAVAGFAPSTTRRQATQLAASLGFSRVCEPGRLQTPSIDWPHDGRPLLSSLTRSIETI